MKAGTIVLAVLLVGGCATATVPRGKADLLGFLREGTTSTEDALVGLGEPSGVFDNGKIFTYRLSKDKAGQVHLLVPVPPVTATAWRPVQFGISLVLIFNADGILQGHALVDVMTAVSE